MTWFFCGKSQGLLRKECGVSHWKALCNTLQDSFHGLGSTKRFLFYRALLQKRPIILRSLRIVASPVLYDWSATHCNTLQNTATHCNTLQHTATHCNTLQHTATHCNTLQHTSTHCNTLQHTATHCNTRIAFNTLCRIRGGSHVVKSHVWYGSFAERDKGFGGKSQGLWRKD